MVKQYNKVRKISTGQGDDYATGFLLDFAYFKDDFRLIAVNLSKQKALDADSLKVFYILEKSKETLLEFAKGTTKVLKLI